MWIVWMAGCPLITQGDLTLLRDLDQDGFDGHTRGGTDCDDTDPAVHPGHPERCDGVDNDCDGLIDDLDDDVVDATFVYDDHDRDGLGADGRLSCTLRRGQTVTGGDCDDARPYVTDRRYLDADGDGFGDPATWQRACDEEEGWTLLPGDCDDRDVRAHPHVDEVPRDGLDNDCDGGTDLEPDRDGWPAFPGSDPCASAPLRLHHVPADFGGITEALARAQACDTILVSEGTYSGFVVDKPVRIVARDRETVRIVGDPFDEIGIEVLLPQGRTAVLDRLEISGFPVGLSHASGHLLASVDISASDLGLLEIGLDPEAHLELVSSTLSDLGMALTQLGGKTTLQATHIESVRSLSSVIGLFIGDLDLLDVEIRDSVALGGSIVDLLSVGQVHVDGLRLISNAGSAIDVTTPVTTLSDVEIRDSVSTDDAFVRLRGLLVGNISVDGLFLEGNTWLPADPVLAAPGLIESSSIGDKELRNVTLIDNVLPPDLAHIALSDTLNTIELSQIAILGDGGNGLSFNDFLSAARLEHLTLVNLDQAIRSGALTSVEVSASLLVGNQRAFGGPSILVQVSNSALLGNCSDGAEVDPGDNLTEGEAGFVRYHPELPSHLIDPTLAPDAPARDRLPGCTEADGTPCDLGAHGGPGFDPSRLSQDVDADGLYDAWECTASDDPACRCFDDDRFLCDETNFVGLDPDQDLDGDGWSASEEFAAGTLPHLADSDGDGLPDPADPEPLDGDHAQDHCGSSWFTAARRAP